MDKCLEKEAISSIFEQFWSKKVAGVFHDVVVSKNKSFLALF